MKSGAIILAGGKSSRMGTNKALLPIGNETNIERIRNVLEEVVTDILLVTNSPEEYEFLQLPMVEDECKGKGPLAGLHAGLMHAIHEVNFVVACDMPFVEKELVSFLLMQSEDVEAVVPSIQGKLHPLFAVYKTSVLPQAAHCLAQGQLRMTDLLDKLKKVRIMDEKEIPQLAEMDLYRAFFNMNHPYEYEQAKAWTREKEKGGFNI